MVKHSRKKVPEKANMSKPCRAYSTKSLVTHETKGTVTSAEAAVVQCTKNLYKHEWTEAHIAAAKRRDDRERLNPLVDDAPVLMPETMDWKADPNQLPAKDPPIAPELDIHELGLDLAFIEQDSFYSEETDHTRASPQANGQSRGAWGRKRIDKWWPFKSVEYLIGCLVVGHTRTIISRAIYNHVRMGFDICAVKLPDWTTIRRVNTDLRKMIGLEVVGRLLVMNTPVHYLSLKKILGLELANLLVEPHLRYYPEMTGGRNILRLSQSSKWLEELSPNTRAQMVWNNEHNFYLFELVQLQSGLIVIPGFFYECAGEMYAHCLTPTIDANQDNGQLVISIAKDAIFSSPEYTSISVAGFNVEYPLMEAPDGSLFF
ncbi:hypothetical protein PTTG_28999 [Puccinia triticina 1-1 BBBD Race 1]|uniref:Uncharacterized protein n=1 Tax=Puccinia triticina (isolate 1-1 / race 1 (BBBD)) TaxID=630390 RepID=A0A180G775_PUCT1|nr:hypothetical protein PTTG_28999 [Puccinia triticina 1-1 BBBD Race 1]